MKYSLALRISEVRRILRIIAMTKDLLLIFEENSSRQSSVTQIEIPIKNVIGLI
jgi:hypothetical protein